MAKRIDSGEEGLGVNLGSLLRVAQPVLKKAEVARPYINSTHSELVSLRFVVRLE